MSTDTYFTSTPTSEWDFVSFLRYKICHGENVKISNLVKLYMQFHHKLNNIKEAANDTNLQRYLGRVKKQNQFTKSQLSECLDKAQCSDLSSTTATTISLTGTFEIGQIGDNNKLTIVKTPQTPQPPPATAESPSNSSDSTDHIENEDLLSVRLNDDTTVGAITNRHQFRNILFDTTYKKFRNDLVLEDVNRLNKMHRLLPIPTTIGECLDDFSHSLIGNESSNSLLKLSLSRIVYLVNKEYAVPLRRYLNKNNLGSVWKRLVLSNVILPEGLNGIIKKKIMDLIESAKEEDSNLKINLRKAISTQRLELLDNNVVDSTLMQVLDILDIIVTSIDTTNSRHELQTNIIKSETTYYQRFSVILHILLRDTILDAADGEQASQASKDIMTNCSKTFGSAIYNDNIVGRKIDLMIKSSGVELSASEWKKKSADKTTTKDQQVKNVRGNKAILKKLLSLPIPDADRENVFCVGMDFVGTVGYMFSVHHVDDAYVATSISDIRLPTDFTQLDGFVETLDNLFKFKNHHTRLQNIIDPAYRRHREDQALIQLRTTARRPLSDDSEDDNDDETPDISPNTFFSPRKKRANSRTNNEDDDQ